jgi:transcriptional regulator with XRE-family HTH domain
VPAARGLEVFYRDQVPPDMRYGGWIRRERKRLGLTQRELGQRIGATDGYISHLEKELKVPSPQLALDLAQALGFSPRQQREFLEAVDAVRLERSRRRIKTRGAAVRDSLGAPPDSEEATPIEAQQIQQALESDPELASAFHNLLIAYSDPDYRDAVVKTLEGLAQTAQPSEPLLHHLEATHKRITKL